MEIGIRLYGIIFAAAEDLSSQAQTMKGMVLEMASLLMGTSQRAAAPKAVDKGHIVLPARTIRKAAKETPHRSRKPHETIPLDEN
jgi:hypothetical protein